MVPLSISVLTLYDMSAIINHRVFYKYKRKIFMDFNVIGGNENAGITIKEKQDGDILYLYVNMN